MTETKNEEKEEFNIQLQFNTTLDTFLLQNQTDTQGCLAVILTYRDFLNSNIKEKKVSRMGFATWLESIDRNIEEFEHGWEADLTHALDQITIKALTTENLPPKQVADKYESWLEETLEEVKEVHDLEDDYFDEMVTNFKNKET